MLKYTPTRFSNLLIDICVKRLRGIEVAQLHNISEGRVSQLKKQIQSLKYPPRIEHNLIVCFKCGSTDWLGFHHQHGKKEGAIAILCQSCNMRIGKNELAFEYSPEEWKEGFKELFSFFEAVMKQSKRIIKNEVVWNGLLNQRNLVLIDKLGDEI